MTSKQIAALLKRIRKRVEATQWVQGHFWTHDGGKDQYCLVGFIRNELGAQRDQVLYRTNSPDEYQIRKLLTDEINVRFYPNGKRTNPIEQWNDRKKTTRLDVIRVLDSVIAKL